MTRDSIADPEVIADLRLRAASERSRGKPGDQRALAQVVVDERLELADRRGHRVGVAPGRQLICEADLASRRASRRQDSSYAALDLAFTPTSTAAHQICGTDLASRRAQCGHLRWTDLPDRVRGTASTSCPARREFKHRAASEHRICETDRI